MRERDFHDERVTVARIPLYKCDFSLRNRENGRGQSFEALYSSHTLVHFPRSWQTWVSKQPRLLPFQRVNKSADGLQMHERTSLQLLVNMTNTRGGSEYSGIKNTHPSTIEGDAKRRGKNKETEIGNRAMF